MNLDDNCNSLLLVDIKTEPLDFDDVSAFKALVDSFQSVQCKPIDGPHSAQSISDTTTLEPGPSENLTPRDELGSPHQTNTGSSPEESSTETRPDDLHAQGRLRPRQIQTPNPILPKSNQKKKTKKVVSNGKKKKTKKPSRRIIVSGKKSDKTATNYINHANNKTSAPKRKPKKKHVDLEYHRQYQSEYRRRKKEQLELLYKSPLASIINSSNDSVGGQVASSDETRRSDSSASSSIAIPCQQSLQEESSIDFGPEVSKTKILVKNEFEKVKNFYEKVNNPPSTVAVAELIQLDKDATNQMDLFSALFRRYIKERRAVLLKATKLPK